MLGILLFMLLSLIIGVGYIILRQKIGEKTTKPVILVRFVLAGLIIGMLLKVFVIIQAGTVGVIDFWGHVYPTPLKAGVNLRNPLADIRVFSIKTHEMKEEMDTPSQEGLITHLEVSVWYRVMPDKAPEIFKTIGLSYEDVILKPLLRSALRTVTAEHEAKALYTAGRETIVSEMQGIVEPVAKEKGILVEKVLLRSVKLPELVTQAIERKLQAEQQAEQMKFVLMREKQEAERKRIEGQGIADFQRIVTKGITPSLLEWKGIEATERLAESSNSKIVIIGNPENGLPLIFEGQK